MCLESAFLALKHSFQYKNLKEFDDFDKKLNNLLSDMSYMDCYRMLLDIAIAND